MTAQQHFWDVAVRSIKTALAVYASFMAAGGMNLLHVSTTLQLQVAALAAFATALLNLLLKLHQAIMADPTPMATPVVITPDQPTTGVTP